MRKYKHMFCGIWHDTMQHLELYYTFTYVFIQFSIIP